MQRFLMAVAIAVIALPSLAENVGVSVSIGEPGFFGRIDIGDYPQPRVLYPQPVIIERGAAERAPIYLRVPPGYAKHWGQHCHEYHACGERVLFVQNDWYQHEYIPRYQAHHRDEHHDDRRDDRDHHQDDHGHDHDRDRDR